MEIKEFTDHYKDRILTRIDGIIIHSPFLHDIGKDISSSKLKRKHKRNPTPVVNCEFTWILEKNRIRQNQGVIQNVCFQWELKGQLDLLMLELYHSNTAMRYCLIEDYRTSFDWNRDHQISKTEFPESRGAHIFYNGYWNDETRLTFYLYDKWTDTNIRAEGFQ